MFELAGLPSLQLPDGSMAQVTAFGLEQPTEEAPTEVPSDPPEASTCP